MSRLKRLRNWHLVLLLCSPFAAIAAEIAAFVYVGLWAGMLLLPVVMVTSFGLSVLGPEADERFRHWLESDPDAALTPPPSGEV